MLRETRMRERIDITDVESATKIRAKYLRALENEEWDLLPGPTFVKTFLRTYGDYLGLDSKLLVEEYKQRFERPAQADLMPFSARSGGRRPPRRPPSVPPWAIVGVVILALMGILALLGSLGGGDDEPSLTPASTPTASPEQDAAGKPKATATPKKVTAARVSMRLTADGLVNVCLIDASGKRVLDSVDLEAGRTTKVFRSKRFRAAFGNGAVRIRIGSKSYDVPNRSNPIGMEILPGKAPRELPVASRPACT